MTVQSTATGLSRLELGVLDAMDALTDCPECPMGTFAMRLYFDHGRVKVKCGTCLVIRDYDCSLARATENGYPRERASSEPSPVLSIRPVVSQLELAILDAMDALTKCTWCKLGTVALVLYRANGRIRVECEMCAEDRAFADAHRMTA